MGRTTHIRMLESSRSSGPAIALYLTHDPRTDREALRKVYRTVWRRKYNMKWCSVLNHFTKLWKPEPQHAEIKSLHSIWRLNSSYFISMNYDTHVLSPGLFQNKSLERMSRGYFYPDNSTIQRLKASARHRASVIDTSLIILLVVGQWLQIAPTPELNCVN